MSGNNNNVLKKKSVPLNLLPIKVHNCLIFTGDTETSDFRSTPLFFFLSFFMLAVDRWQKFLSSFMPYTFKNIY